MEFTKNRYTPAVAREMIPRGWLKTQLLTEAQGLAGNLDRVWGDVRDSKWIGGDREGWERVPYWLDGFVPLAFLLRDEDMIARATKYIDAILANQCEDGWICPCTMEERPGYDMWALLLLSKVLTGYAECRPEYADRIENALVRAFRQASEHLKEHPLEYWGKYRWFEGLIAVFWLYNRKPESWLLDFARLLHDQGKDFVALIEKDFSAYEQAENKWQWDTHIVNLGMALKADTLWQKLCGTPAEEADRFSRKMYETLYRFHGMPSGLIAGDECLAGRIPNRGAELCSVCESMYSDEWNLAITGNPFWGDLLERLAFNALPATISTDMWTHQYDQQTNQIACAMEADKPIFGTNSRDANLFGLEPSYGCCTANMPQGWPKFALSVFMKNEDAILSAVPAPASFTTCLHGALVTVSCDTLYPFRDRATYTVTADCPVEFSFDIRIPGSATSASLNGEPVTPGTIVSLRKTWQGEESVTLDMQFVPQMVSAGYSNLLCVNRGPLLYSMPISYQKVMSEYTRNGVERRFPYCDYQLFPTSRWAYGFADDCFTYEEQDIDIRYPLFDQNRPPVILHASLTPIDWGKNDNYAWSCADEPHSTVPAGKTVSLPMIPFGCTDLRMTAMPLVGRA